MTTTRGKGGYVFIDARGTARGRGLAWSTFLELLSHLPSGTDSLPDDMLAAVTRTAATAS
jgi:hypothetical protein